MRRSAANAPEAPGSARAPAKKPRPSAEGPREKEGVRETVEAVVVAMILALLVRGFEAEAFVIPTGSMAPTLMGRHKEILCPQCGYLYAVNASDEVESTNGVLPRGRRVYSGICVNCRFQAHVDDAPSFKGDRILVMKFPYDLSFLPGASGPERWDVVVFRYPEEPEVSYIKRLVGLPGEVLKVYFGDVYIKRPGETEFRIERKPLRHQRSMQMMVHDDTHRPKALRNRPEWARWSSPEGWREETPGTYVTAAAPAGPSGWTELRYRHLVPEPEQWDAIANDRPLPKAPRPTLITDFYSYNTNLTLESSNLTDYPRGDQENAWLQPHWVGDLSLSGRLDVKAATGTVRFELIEGGVANRCDLDLEKGLATLFHGAEKLGAAPSGIKGPGTHSFEFANMDDRLTLVVNGRTPFGEGLTYASAAPHLAPDRQDLAPAGVAARGASAAVSDLVLKRDIYYTQYPSLSDYSQSWEERAPRRPGDLFDILADPAQFPALGDLRSHEYPIGPDRFMMLGDNSPRSKDSRGWTTRDRFDPDQPDYGWDSTNRSSWEVPRALVTGKAFFIYWPHGKPFGPDIRINQDFRVPFRPYLERMKWIR